MTNIIEFLDGISPFITAVSTAVLAVVTAVLAFMTKRMAEASSQPFVVATFEVNQWSFKHCDLVISNSGNAPAFDIEVEMDPDTRTGFISGGQSTEPIPMKYISVLPPGKEMRSSFSEIGEVMGEENTRRICIKWKKGLKRNKVESITYDYFFPSGMGWLGDWSPEVKIANQMEKIRNDWKRVASGGGRLKVDAHLWKK